MSSKGSNCGAQPEGEKHEKTKKAAREVLIMGAVDSFHCLHTLFYLDSLHVITQQTATTCSYMYILYFMTMQLI